MNYPTTEEVRAAVLRENPENKDKILEMLDRPELWDYFLIKDTIYRYGVHGDGWSAYSITNLDTDRVE
jgi:hypothetical protein